MSGCGNPGQQQPPVAAAALLGPALIVIRAQQLCVECALVVIAIFALMGHSFSYEVYSGDLEALHIAMAALYLVLALASIALTCTFLAHTASPHLRRRSCRGPSTPCLNYSCDLGWDITAAVIWGGMIFVSLMWVPGAFIFNILLVEMFITSAVLSGLVQKRLRLRRAVGGDIEVAGQPAVSGVVHKPSAELCVRPPAPL